MKVDESFSRELDLSADPARCWAAVTDVEKVESWIGMLEHTIEHEHLGHYSAVLADRVGPFILRADLSIEVTDVCEGKSISLRAEGRDRQADSRLFAEGRLEVSPTRQGCRIEVEGRYEVTGAIVALGARMIVSKAEGMIADFFSAITHELE